MDYEREGADRYEEEPRYGDRDRSRSPRPAKDESYDRQRSASPNGRVASRDPPERSGGEEQASNPGSNLFVTGIHPRLTEQDVTEMFGKYGQVESCSIMKDPHSHESRGFGFVKMVTSEHADAARDALQGENIEGRTLSIEKARRNRPRTPTPGRYFGPPKRDDPRGGGGRRFDDRRGGYGGGDRYARGGGGGDDYYRGGGGGDDRYGDRRGGYGRRDDYRGGDRYRRDDYDRRDDRRGGGGGGYSGRGGDEYRSGGGGGAREGGYERQNRDYRAGGGGGDESYSRR